MVMNLLSFRLSDNGLLSPSFLKYIFSGYWILNLKLYFFCALQTSYHYIVTFIISVENPAVSLILALLKYGRLNEGFPCGSADKESNCNGGNWGLIPGLGRSPGEGKGYPFQYSDLENSTDCIVHGVAKSQTRLSDFHSTHLWERSHRTRKTQKE